MAWIIGDSFDFYTTVSDSVGLWDGWTPSSNYSLQPGRFTGSQALQNNNGAGILGPVKSSGSNDATHHIVVSFIQAGLSGTAINTYMSLFDGTTAQCTICFRSDGAILLTSGGPAGTVLATYAAAFTANAWTAFEFEVTINNTTGAFHVRKNGNTADDFVATGLNTRGGTTNNYANKLQMGNSASIISTQTQRIDDFLWFSTSGAVPNTWVGDIRAVQLMPSTDTTTKAFAATAPALAVTPYVADNTSTKAAGNGIMGSFTASFSGTIGSVQVQINTGGTGNLKAAIYDSGRATVLATSNALVNPVAGANTVVFGTPLTVTKGTTYNLALDSDFSITYSVHLISSLGWTFSTAYASFPAAGPVTTAGVAPVFTVTITPTVNAEFVSETLEDGDTSYVSDSVVGHNDLYNITPLPTPPLTVVAVQTRGLMRKSDAGLRAAQVQVKSGATTVTSAAFNLSTNYQTVSRVDAVDPNTSAAWSGTAINAIQIGPVVQA